MAELSLTPAQSGVADELGAVIVETSQIDGKGDLPPMTIARAVRPDLSEWLIGPEGAVDDDPVTAGPSLELPQDWDATAIGPEPEALGAVIKQLRRPMTPAAVRWKVQTSIGKKAQPSGALIVPYIDARLVIDRLNRVCPGAWQEGDVTRPELAPFEVVNWGRGGMLCRLSVCGVPRQDVGVHSETKAIVSDSLKRAAVKFGIGHFLYSIPKVQFDAVSPNLRWWDTTDMKGNPIKKPFLTEAGEAELPLLYTEWLWRHGVQAFGAPLDHGDSAEAVGDFEGGVELQPEDGTPIEPADPDAPPSEEKKARAKMRAAAAGEQKS